MMLEMLWLIFLTSTSLQAAEVPASPAKVVTVVPVAITPPAKVFQAGEKLDFTLKFIDTTAGECQMETLPPIDFEGKKALHFRATVKTIGLIGLIYPYLQTIDLYSDPATAKPLFVDIHIKDRKKTQHTQIRLDSVSLKGEEIERSSEPDRENHERIKRWAMAPNSQSLFSILYFVRLLDMSVGSKMSFPISHDEKNTTFTAELLRTEKLKIGSQVKDAVVMKVSQEFTNAFYTSVKDEPLLWFSNDAAKIPLRFEFKHRIGKIFAVLRNPN